MAKNERGITLGGTLLVVALLATLGFALAGVSVSHLSLLARSTGSARAHNLARSVVAEGIARVLADKAYGSARLPNEILQVTSEDGEAWLAFHEATAQQWGVPASTNNIESTESQEGPAGRVVPAASVHLVGVARAGGATRTVEAYLHVPPFPYAIASSGPVRTEGGVLIAGLKPGQTLPATPNLDDLLPADLLSNAEGDDAIYLGANTTISGDVETAGGVIFSQSSSIAILGEVRQRSGEQPVPEIDTSRFDPANRGMAYESVGGDLPGVVTGSIRSNQSVVVSSGLELDGALVFVDGDLTVYGGLKGNGVLVVTGRTSINGPVNIDSAGKVALLSRGQINLTGQGQHSSRFRGLVYTEEGFRADKVTVEGTLVVAGGESAPGVSLKDSRLLHDPDTSVVPLPSPPATGLSQAGPGAYPMAFRITTNPGKPPEISVGDPSDPASYDVVIKVGIDPEGGCAISCGISPDSPIFSGTAPGVNEQTGNDLQANNSNPDAWEKMVQSWIETELVAKTPELFGLTAPLMAAVKNQMGVVAGQGGAEEVPPEEEIPVIEVIDPSEFLSIEDRIRLLHWTEY